MQRAVEACSRFFLSFGGNSAPSGQTRMFRFSSFSIRDLLKSKTPDCNCIHLRYESSPLIGCCSDTCERNQEVGHSSLRFLPSALHSLPAVTQDWIRKTKDRNVYLGHRRTKNIRIKMSSCVPQTYIIAEHKCFAPWEHDLELSSTRSVDGVDGVDEVGEVKVSDVQLEGETDDKTPSENKSPDVCECIHGTIHDKAHRPLMRAVLCCPVCKVYRFPTDDQRWLLVQEQMSETPLSFSVPKQLLSLLIKEYKKRTREVQELCGLAPHLEELRGDVVSRCDHMMSYYQTLLFEANRISESSSFKASSSKSDAHLQFVPTNLHSQRMEVISPGSTGVWYEVITFGAPADHHQGFKQGGLKRLLSKLNDSSSVSYSEEERSRARELLSNVTRIQPLVFGLAEELLAVSLEVNVNRLQNVLNALARQTDEFVHALKDELVKSALLDEHKQKSARCVYICNGNPPSNTSAKQERRLSVEPLEASRSEEEYDEEEWDRVWTNVGKSLNCIIAMADRLRRKEEQHQAAKSSEEQDTDSPNTGAPPSPSTALSWQEQLLPLVVTLRDCVREAVGQACAAMAFVLLQGAAAATVGQGSAQLMQRRHAVFSQALSAVTCGFILKLYNSLEDADFLQQLLYVGILAQFEGLLSTYGYELGMLEDMEVGVADLRNVAFTLIEAKSDQSDDLLPTVTGTWDNLVVNVPLPSENFSTLPWELKDGHLIQLHPVFFNIGINQQQTLAERFGDSSLQERLNQESCDRLKTYCDKLRDRLPHMEDIETLTDLLSSLEASVETKQKKNVEVLWHAAAVCHKVSGIRLTSCKSAKDRTAMSVTLEQCVLLKEKHGLHQEHFSSALDSMRRDGCRLENTLKNVGIKKFAFIGVQLFAFPKLYRPPDGTYGHTMT